MIVVMPDANTTRRGYFNVIDGSYNFEDFFFEELIPHIEKTYRVRSERRYRAISGLSMGGGGTLFYTLHRPEMFAAAAPLSAFAGFWNMEATKSRMDTSKYDEETLEAYAKIQNVESQLADASEEKMKQIRSVRWYISCGDDDFLAEGNSLLHIQFLKNKIPHEYRVKDGAHTWTYWRMELPLVMEFVAKSFMQY